MTSASPSATPVRDGPAGSRLALIICHDGMFPRWRASRLLRRDVMIRTAGYTAPIRHASAYGFPTAEAAERAGLEPVSW